MKIDKAIFSCSEPATYSSYWNIQSKLYKVGLGIEPICLLFGKKANTSMTEEYGKVIEMDILPDLPWAIQMTWSKFDYTRNEPETTWIIGDIDLLPLQKHHFTKKIADLPNEDYACLNGAGISAPRLGTMDGFEVVGSQRHGIVGGFVGADIPAHYHVSKGKNFERLYYPNGRSFKDTVKHIVDSDLYGMGPMGAVPKTDKEKNPYWYYWCAEENYTSEYLWRSWREKRIGYHSITYHNEIERLWKWDKDRQTYIHNPKDLLDKRIVDIHCSQVRPYELQADGLNTVIELSGVLR